MQAARISNRPVRLCCSQDGLTVGATNIGSKTGFPLKVNLLSNISWSRLGCKSKNKVIVDLHLQIISLQVHLSHHVCYCHVMLNAVICDNLGQELNCPELTRHRGPKKHLMYTLSVHYHLREILHLKHFLVKLFYTKQNFPVAGF